MKTCVLVFEVMYVDYQALRSHCLAQGFPPNLSLTLYPLQHFDRLKCTPKISYDKKVE